MGSGQENLDQNDGFTDCADLSNVTSDEGTDADVQKKQKAMFNDEDAENQLDISKLIENLDDDEEIKKYDAVKSLKRFKCPFCPHHSKEKRRVEQHIVYAHKKGNFKKNMARGQQMMIFIEKKGVGKNDKIEAIEQLVEYNESSKVDEIMRTMPFFKFSNDDKIDSIEDKGIENNTMAVDISKGIKLEVLSKRGSNSSASASESSKASSEAYRLSDSAGFVNKTELKESKRERKKPNHAKDFVWETASAKKPSEASDNEDNKKKDNEKGKKYLFQPALLVQDKEKDENKRRVRNTSSPVPEKRESRRKKESQDNESDEATKNDADKVSPEKRESRRKKCEVEFNLSSSRDESPAISPNKRDSRRKKENKEESDNLNKKDSIGTATSLATPEKRESRRKIQVEAEDQKKNIVEDKTKENASPMKRELRRKAENDPKEEKEGKESPEKRETKRS